MTQYLPGNLLALFTARPAIPFKPPVDRLKKRKNQVPYSQMTSFLTHFETVPPPPATRGETREEQLERKKAEKKAAADKVLEEKLLKWDPHSDQNATGDPFKTLFVARINYDTTESKLRRELETYGPIRQINMICNIRTRKPRGYALVEYEHERDMHSAYKHADGKKIDGRRILVDVERGRTVKSWRPRRLGGGLGGTRIGAPDDNVRHSGRVEQWESTGGGRDRGERSDRDKESRVEEKPRKRSRSPRERRDRDRDRDRERRRDRDRDREGRGDRGEREREMREDRPERGDRGNRDDRPEDGEHVERPEHADDDGDRERRERRRRDRERRDRDRDGDRDRDRRGRDHDRDGERDGDRDRREVKKEDGEGEHDRDGGDRDRERERERERYRQTRDEGEIPDDDAMEPSDGRGNDVQMNQSNKREERNGESNDRIDDGAIDDERLRFDAKVKMEYPTAVYE